MTASYAETNFSDVLTQVMNGERFEILHGGSNEPVAMIVPIENKATREIGVLNGKATFAQKGDGKISEEDFLGL